MFIDAKEQTSELNKSRVTTKMETNSAEYQAPSMSRVEELGEQVNYKRSK